MSRVRMLLIIQVAMVSCLSRPLRALDDWQPILPEELKMTADPAHPVDAIILYHEELADDKQNRSIVYKRVKIFTEKAKGLANVEIPYNATDIHIIDVKARTIAPDGTITPFNGKVFDSTIVKGQGIKVLAKTFTLPNVQVGSIIEWRYTTWWESLAYGAHWIVQEDLPQKRAKFTFIPWIQNGEMVVDEHGATKDRVYSQVMGIPQNAIKNVMGGKMELELKDIPAYEEEDFSLPSDLLKMRVNFYYGADNMLKPADFWKEQGKYWTKEVDKAIGHSSAISAAANELVGASDTPEQKARKIYARVQKMKNLNYESEQGSLEEFLSHKSTEKRTLEDVLRKNAGFRNELTRLFVAMVRAANLPGFAMRVADRDEVLFQENVPDPSQLTSEIAIVVIDGKDVFLDPGTPVCPFGLLKWQHTGTRGIRQTAGGGSALAATPLPTYKDAVSKRVGRLTLSEDGSLRGTILVAWAGEEALDHRLSGYRTDEAGRKKELEDEMKRLLPPGSVVRFESASGWEDADNQLSVSFSAEVPSFAATTGKRLLVPNTLFEGNRRQPFGHGERKHPIYFSYPYYAEDDVQITLPSGLRVENMPQEPPISPGFAFYQLKRSANANVLVLNRLFAVGEVVFPQGEYDALRKFFAGVTSGDSEQVVLTVAAK
jgi:Domain of Unknown Function with PDB structure (DUF3857)/Transglutaminase-like superfamily